jgi:hypothetical protein
MIQKLIPDNRKPYDRPNDDVTQVLVQSDGNNASVFVDKNSLRFNRKVFTVAVTGFVIGAVLILMQSPYRNQLITPGPLKSTHAQIIASQTGDQCAACHDVGSQNFGQWLTGMSTPGKEVQACQSELCMKCHSQSLNVEFATKPHNVSPEKLRQVSEKYKTQFVSYKVGLDPPVDHEGNIQCSSCHREHHGQSDLKAMTDQQCQSCHSAPFDSFESGHPEFANWPQKRRSRIAFDHTSHKFKHFAGKNEAFECSMCHVDDKFQSVKLLAGYEQACAKCHQQDVDGRSEPGVQLLAIPEMMRMLLFKDDVARKVLEKHGPDFEFGDLDPSDSANVADAVGLAWAIKYLVYDLATLGNRELRSRLEYSLQRSVSEDEFFEISKGLDRRVFVDLANKWFPNLINEVPNHRARSVNNTGVAKIIHSQDPFFYFKDDEPGLLKKNPIPGLLEPDKKVVETPLAATNGGSSDSVDSPPAVPAANENVPANKNLANEQSKDSSSNWLTGESESTTTEPAPEVEQLATTQPATLASTPPQRNANDSEPSVDSNAKVNVPQIPEEELLARNPVSQLAGRSAAGNVAPNASASNQSSSQQQVIQNPAVERQPTVNQNASVVTNKSPSKRIVSQGPGTATNKFRLNSDQNSPIDDADLLVNNPLTMENVQRAGEGSVTANPTGQPVVGQQYIAGTNQSNPKTNQSVAATESGPTVQPFKQIDESELLANNPLWENQQKSIPQIPAGGLTSPPSNAGDGGSVVRQQPKLDVVVGTDLTDEQEEKIANEFAQQLADSQSTQANDDVVEGKQFTVESDDREKFVSSSLKSGWFRNDDYFQISYRPSGHADKFLATMMNVVGQSGNVKENPAVLPYFNKMLSAASVGACNDCHSVDSVEEKHEVNWRAQYRDPMYRSFTRFSHGPHLTQVQLQDCSACHQVQELHANAHTFKHFDPTDAVSNFAAITKSNCISCHFKGSADSSCTQCHNYHVGSRVLIGE